MASNSFIELMSDEIIGRTIDLMRYSEELRRDVLRFLVQLENDITNALIGKDPTVRANTAYQRQRLMQLREQITKTIRTSYRRIGKHVNGELASIADLEQVFVVNRMNRILGANVTTTALSPDVLKTIVEGGIIEGAINAEWWSRQATGLRNRFMDEVGKGIVLGETLDDIVRRIRGRHTGKFTTVILENGKKKRYGIFEGGIMDVNTRQAEALVRTAIQNVAQSTRMKLYQQNADIIKGVEALATLDNRTTDLCKSRDGQAWYLDGTPMENPRTGKMTTSDPYPGDPPWHWNCRTQIMPVTYGWAELAGPKSKISKEKLRELDRRIDPKGKSSMDGYVSGAINYEQWLKGKSVSFQQEVLGMGKWQLWREGKIVFDDLVDQRNNVLTLGELIDKTLAMNLPTEVLIQMQRMYKGRKLQQQLIGRWNFLADRYGPATATRAMGDFEGIKAYLTKLYNSLIAEGQSSAKAKAAVGGFKPTKPIGKAKKLPVFAEKPKMSPDTPIVREPDKLPGFESVASKADDLYSNQILASNESVDLEAIKEHLQQIYAVNKRKEFFDWLPDGIRVNPALQKAYGENVYGAYFDKVRIIRLMKLTKNNKLSHHVFIHEYGHFIDGNLERMGAWGRTAKSWRHKMLAEFEKTRDKVEELFGLTGRKDSWRVIAETSGSLWNDYTVSAYSLSNDWEWFAEYFSYYVRGSEANRDRLRRWAPDTVKYIEYILGIQEKVPFRKVIKRRRV